MENIQKNPSQTLFHTQILDSELKQLNLDSRKMVLQQWCDRLGELRQQDHISQVSAFTSEILEKLLGYSASGNTVTIAPDSTPEPFFDILVGQFKPAKQQAIAAWKLEAGADLSSEAGQLFEKEAWKFSELQKDGFYLLSDLNEIRLYPRNRKIKVYERFVLADMLEDSAAFSRFYLLLNATNLLSGKTTGWLQESARRFLDEKLKGSYQTLRQMYRPRISWYRHRT